MDTDEDLLLPEGARLVHIGLHKTGSTAIQVALHEARDQLAVHDVEYAGRTTRPRKAGWALGLRGLPKGTPRPPLEHWQRFVRDVSQSEASRICISNEDFGRADAEQAARIVSDLGGDRVHVVAAARRLDGYLPSQWQERVKAGDTRPYEQWLRIVLEGGSETWDHRNVWSAHDVVHLVRRWTSLVGHDRFTLIVSNERDREQLPRTFESMLGLPPATLQLFPERSNRSLSWGETELVRLLHNDLKQAGWSLAERRGFVKHTLVGSLARHAAAPAGPRTPALPEWAREPLYRIGEDRAAALTSFIRSGVRVVGDPDHLRSPHLRGLPEDAAPEGRPVVLSSTAAEVVALALSADAARSPSPPSMPPPD